MDPDGKIYTIDEFRCWKVENLDNEPITLQTRQNSIGKFLCTMRL